MVVFSCRLLLFLIFVTKLLHISNASNHNNPIHNVQVTLKGEVYYISDITTVQELYDRLEDESGLTSSEIGNASFQGNVLTPMDDLGTVGVADGDQINMIPSSMADQLRTMNEMRQGLTDLVNNCNSNSLQENEDLLVLFDLYQDMTKVPYLQEEMERFSEALRNPMIIERSKDPQRIEQLRQVIINNPLLLSYVKESPGIDDTVLSDPNLWFQAVLNAINRWKTMDGYELWQALIDGTFFASDPLSYVEEHDDEEWF